MPELTSALSAPARLHALSEMVDAVASVYRVSPDDIYMLGRTKQVAEARCCIYLLARRCTRLSYPEIGRLLTRDHTTVMSGVKSAERLLAADRWFAAAVAELCERFGAMREEERMQ